MIGTNSTRTIHVLAVAAPRPEVKVRVKVTETNVPAYTIPVRLDPEMIPKVIRVLVKEG